MRRPEYPYTPGLLHRISSVPKSTIVNWLEGRVERPRRWEDVIQVAAALRLTAADADRLLQAAGHLRIAALRAITSDPKGRALLDPWPEAGPPATELPAVPSPLPPRLHILPAPPTPLIGRTGEAAMITSLLAQAHVRLVTLTGPGGAGKTRLALHVAAGLLPGFADGGAFIALDSVRDPELVAVALAQAIGVADMGGQALTRQLTVALRDREMLLVIDTFEHLLGAANLVAELLAAAPKLKVMVTSRAILSVAGEHTFSVPPLVCADPRDLPSGDAEAVSALATCEAVQLFVARSRAVRGDFTLTDANTRTVAEICYHLDGLPLAIELAAARSRVLTPQALLARIVGAGGQRPLDFLAGSTRDRPAHQQTLRGTIDWSYQLLTAGEQLLLARLSVFGGGATIESAEFVCSAGGDLPLDLLDSLTSLVDKSLLRWAGPPEGIPRFGMLETIRTYARERLAEQADYERTRRRYVQWALDLAEAAEAHMHTAEEVAWLDMLEAERDNIRGAMAWAREDADPALGARLASALGEFCWARGYVTLGRHWLSDGLARGGHLPLAVRAKALARAGMLAWIQGDYNEAWDRCAAAQRLYSALDDVAGQAWALRHMAYVVWDRGDYAQTATLMGESLDLARAANDPRGSARALHLLGWLAILHNDEPQATACYQECLDLSRAVGDRQFVAHAINDLGLQQRRRGAYAQATVLLTEGLALRRELGVKVGIAWSCLNLGLVARDQGDYPQAMAWFSESLSIRRDLGDRRGVAECLEAIAAVDSLTRQGERGVRLYGVAAQLRAEISAPVLPLRSDDYTPYVARVRALLGDDAFALGWAAGGRMSLEQVLAYREP
jgi:predicted ATPase